jgi:DNA-binding PucR family transcriptional regulator
LTAFTGNWLDLLLEDREFADLQKHRARLLRGARGSTEKIAQVEAEADAAVRLKSLLVQHRRRAAELAAVNDIARQLTSIRGRDEVLSEVVMRARTLLDVDLAYLGLITPDGERMRIEVASGALTPELLGLEVPLTAGVAGSVIGHGTPRWSVDYPVDHDIRHDEVADDAANAENLHGLLGVPLIVRGRTLGALFAGERKQRRFEDEEITLLVALATHAAIAIDNSQLLTGYEQTVSSLNDANARLHESTTELERSLSWERSLTEVVLEGGGVRALVARIAGVLDGRVLFVTAGAEPPPNTAGQQTVVPVIAAGRTLGSLVHVANTTTDGSPVPVLERAAPAIALSLLADEAVAEATRLARGAFLDELLNRPSADQRELERQARLARVNLDAVHCVMAIHTGHDMTAAGREAGEKFARRFRAAVGEYGDRLVLVVPGDDPDALRRSWSATEPPSSLTVGVAGPAHGADGLRSAYHEARQVALTLQALGRDGQVATSRELGVYRFLLSHADRTDVIEYAQRTLEPLRRAEQGGGAPLERTLELFLEHGRKHAATARALGIHVNTLYQRLNSISAALGEDWLEPQHVFDLTVALRLQRLARAIDD